MGVKYNSEYDICHNKKLLILDSPLVLIKSSGSGNWQGESERACENDPCHPRRRRDLIYGLQSRRGRDSRRNRGALHRHDFNRIGRDERLLPAPAVQGPQQSLGGNERLHCRGDGTGRLGGSFRRIPER